MYPGPSNFRESSLLFDLLGLFYLTMFISHLVVLAGLLSPWLLTNPVSIIYQGILLCSSHHAKLLFLLTHLHINDLHTSPVYKFFYDIFVYCFANFLPWSPCHFLLFPLSSLESPCLLPCGLNSIILFSFLPYFLSKDLPLSPPYLCSHP